MMISVLRLERKQLWEKENILVSKTFFCTAVKTRDSFGKGL